MRSQPERTSGEGRIDPGRSPPPDFIAAAVDFSMVSPTQRHRELIAHLASEGRGLGEPQVMRVRWSATTDQASLAGNELDVLPVPQAAWLWQMKHTLVDLA